MVLVKNANLGGEKNQPGRVAFDTGPGGICLSRLFRPCNAFPRPHPDMPPKVEDRTAEANSKPHRTRGTSVWAFYKAKLKMIKKSSLPLFPHIEGPSRLLSPFKVLIF